MRKCNLSRQSNTKIVGAKEDQASSVVKGRSEVDTANI
jgi:hypothetical protein